MVRTTEQKRNASRAGVAMGRARILVVSDGFPRSVEALRRALRLIGHGHDVEVVAMAEQNATALASLAPATVVQLSDWERSLHDAPGHKCTEAERTTAALGLSSPVRILHGTPGPAVCRYADDTDADLLVVDGRRGGLLERIFDGLSRHVAAHAPCAVLVAR